MKTQRTIYHLIVDRSGSMNDCSEAAISGFNEQITRIRNMEAKFPEQDIRIGISLFNDQVKTLHLAKSPSEIPAMTRSTYIPDGMTALLDAIGKTTLLLEERFASQNDIPATFVVVVLTDGYENSSSLFNLEQIRSLIRRLENSGKWTFSFIGATLDAVSVAEQMAFRANNSYRFSKLDMSNQVWDRLSDSMNHYFNKKKGGQNLSNLFDEEK